jgi:hypothetical protein
LVQIEILTKARRSPGGDSGLLGVYLPGMEIDDGGLVFSSVEVHDPPLSEYIWIDPEVSPSRDWQIDAPYAHGREGKLGQSCSCTSIDHMTKP